MESNAAISAMSALAQETRLAIFTMLAQYECAGLSAGDIGEKLNIPLPTLSYHLSQLKRAGLVSSRRRSRTIMYSANHNAIDGLIAHLIKNCGPDSDPSNGSATH
ncbi:MAG TPA: metalloregulator ArsR/SmtB family transcription factor [Candidatus Binataceae bacterium]|jgi:DNA-binding transcriptional ArsR family regulator|nr:metalloregulator ArsR/SmtB family transcription factor [Candidatus Binataceae bacterium]